jgi:hypothetical protein
MVRYTPVERSIVLSDLRAQVAEVIFDKENGERRLMHCTLNPHYLPEGTGYPDQTDPDVVTVWDLDQKDWRRFRLDRVLSIQAVNR